MLYTVPSGDLFIKYDKIAKKYGCTVEACVSSAVKPSRKKLYSLVLLTSRGNYYGPGIGLDARCLGILHQIDKGFFAKNIIGPMAMVTGQEFEAVHNYALKNELISYVKLSERIINALGDCYPDKSFLTQFNKDKIRFEFESAIKDYRENCDEILNDWFKFVSQNLVRFPLKWGT